MYNLYKYTLFWTYDILKEKKELSYSINQCAGFTHWNLAL